MSLIKTDIFGETVDKVAVAIQRIRDFCPPEGYYLAFSGGKDSVVILDLAKRSGCKFDAHYQTYRHWTEGNGERPETATKFGRYFGESFDSAKDRGGKVYLGIDVCDGL